ncbi:MAG: FAD-dependent oxidoreductase [Parvularculaceae bacterium]
MNKNYDVAIIGGGFYGCAIALHLSQTCGRVTIFEAESDLLQRASYVNQARVHTGYHYPRSLQTAASSGKNLLLFKDLYDECIDASFIALYAIARSGSKVTAGYFSRFCRQLGLPIRPVRKQLRGLFSPRLIEDVFECEKYAFDAAALKRVMKRRLNEAGVDIQLNTRAKTIAKHNGGGAVVLVETADCEVPVRADWVYNTTYANLNRLGGLDQKKQVGLRHQITEVCLIEPPAALANVGVTVMDGPFFSTMPFPARNRHSLTHVRYTPHFTWHEREDASLSPDQVLAKYSKNSRYEWMLRDARRYLPVLDEARFAETLFEIKTTLTDTEIDDARPIAFHRDLDNPHVISVLGGKIDNIFDVLKVIDAAHKVKAA